MAARYEQADVRFNSGAGALLCNECQIIIDYGFKHEDKKHYCEKCQEKLKINCCPEGTHVG